MESPVTRSNIYITLAIIPACIGKVHVLKRESTHYSATAAATTAAAAAAAAAESST